MVKKDKKSKSAEQKARVAAKQTKKAAKGEKKAKTKSSRDDDSDAEEVDLDAVLAEYAEQQARFLKVTETSCGPPSSRSSATLIASPSNRNELFLFGGEYYDGALATFFNNLYVHLIDRGEWRESTSPNSPLPRSGHAWCRGGNSGGIYLFGGESLYLYRLHHPNSSSNLALICHIAPKRLVHLKALI
jgi:Galactose oxidase, central domain